MTRVPAPMTSELGSAWGWEPCSCAATIGGKLIPSAPTSWNVSWMLQAMSRSLRPTSPSAAIRASTGSMSAAERLTASCSAASFTSRSRSTAPVVGTGGAEAAAARRSCWATVMWALSNPIRWAPGASSARCSQAARMTSRSTWRTSMYASSGAARSV